MYCWKDLAQVPILHCSMARITGKKSCKNCKILTLWQLQKNIALAESYEGNVKVAFNHRYLLTCCRRGSVRVMRGLLAERSRIRRWRNVGSRGFKCWGGRVKSIWTEAEAGACSCDLNLKKEKTVPVIRLKHGVYLVQEGWGKSIQVGVQWGTFH